MATKGLLMAAICATFCATSVQAATTHVFDLSRSGPAATETTANSVELEANGLTGLFTGFYVDGMTLDGSNIVDGGTFTAAEEVTRHNNGLGVCREANCFGTDEPHSVDGSEASIEDYVQMAFSIGGDLVDVTLTALTFGWIGEWDVQGIPVGNEATDGSFEILVETMLDGAIGLGDELVFDGVVTPNLDTFNSRGSFSLVGEDLFGSIFGIKAGDTGSWKLLSVTVEYETPPPPPPPPPIPLPGAFWLMLAGLGGLAGLRRLRAV